MFRLFHTPPTFFFFKSTLENAILQLQNIWLLPDFRVGSAKPKEKKRNLSATKGKPSL